MGDERGMRIGDLLARTYTVQADAAVPDTEAAASEVPAADVRGNDTSP